MRLISHIRLTLIVGCVLAMIAAAVLLFVNQREADAAWRATASSSKAAKAAQRAWRVGLSATPRQTTAGTAVTFTLTSATPHPRRVLLQRWDPHHKRWVTAAHRTVRGSAKVVAKPRAGRWIYRAYAPRVKHRTGGKKHTHRAATSARLSVIVAAAVLPLTGTENALLSTVRTARTTYAGTGASDTGGVNACLTTYARQHSAWMASLGRGADPGSAEHRAARRALPAAACPGWRVSAVTRSVATGPAFSSVAATAVDSLLSSPYGETDRLLSTCEKAPQFSFGVGVVQANGAYWMTVLIGSAAARTTASGVC